jgi:hypothetical protein
LKLKLLDKSDVIYIVACLLKTRTVKSEEIAVARERLSSRHVKSATVEELLEAVFSVRSMPRLHNEEQLPSRVSVQADSQLTAAVAEVGDSSGTQRKGNFHHWKPLPSNAVKTVIENTSLCDSDL